MTREELYEIGLQKKRGERTESWSELNTTLGKPFHCGDSFKSFVNKKFRTQNVNDIGGSELGKYEYRKTISINPDGTQTSEQLIEMAEEEAKDINFILQKHGYDIKVWELVSCRNNIWNVYSKKDGIQVLYSSKIVVKPRKEIGWDKKFVDSLFEDLTNDKICIEPKQYAKNNQILVVPIADLHYNLLSEDIASGNEYNTEIAEDLYYRTLSDVLARNANKKFEKVLFVVGNDFINADNIAGTTTRGTPQDNQHHWFAIISKATQLIINGINMLLEIAPVDVMYVPSNHDLQTMYGIMQTVNAWYRTTTTVSVNYTPDTRKYYKYDKTLLMFAHDVKIKDVLNIITSEAKQYWSECDHMICMLAHLHQSMVYEKQGYLEVLRLPTISGQSRWSNEKGYIQSDRKNKSFIIDGGLGIIDEMNTILT